MMFRDDHRKIWGPHRRLHNGYWSFTFHIIRYGSDLDAHVSKTGAKTSSLKSAI